MDVQRLHLASLRVNFLWLAVAGTLAAQETPELVHVTSEPDMFVPENIVADFDDPAAIVEGGKYELSGVFADGAIAAGGWNDLSGRDDAARVGAASVTTCEIGDGNCDAPVGSIATPTFTVSKPALNLLLSGGNGSNDVGVRILTADGTVLANHTPNSCGDPVIKGDQHWVNFDVSAVMGETLKVEFYDNESAGCGFVSFDHVYQSATARGTAAGDVFLPAKGANVVVDPDRAGPNLIGGAGFEDPVAQVANGGWTTTGAFDNPASADAWVGASAGEAAAARVGDRAVNSCEIGGADCNGPTGTLTSPAFKVTDDYIQFLMAGGNGTAPVGLRITDTLGNALHSYNPESCSPAYLDGNNDWTHLNVAALRNAYVHLQVFDEEAGDCGFVTTDHYYFTDEPWGGTSGMIVTSKDAGTVAATARLGFNVMVGADAFEQVIGDFDDATATLADGWTATGDFAMPATADSWAGTARSSDPAPARIGAGAVSTCEINDNANGCDAPTGTLTSPTFTVAAERPVLKFLMAGGNGTAPVGLEVLSAADDMPIEGYSFVPNSCGPSYIDGGDDWQAMDLSALAGADVRVRVFDNEAGGCGFLSFDHIHMGTTDGVVNRPVSAVTDADSATNAVSIDAEVGTPVGITAMATDPDIGDSVSYSIGGELFAIAAQSGIVTVAADLSTQMAGTEAMVTVTATSSDGSTSMADFAIQLRAMPVDPAQEVVNVTSDPSLFAPANVVATFDDPGAIVAEGSGYTVTGVFADAAVAAEGWNNLAGREGAARIGLAAVSTCEIGGMGCDAPVGSVTTPSFTVTQPYLNMLISGGNGSNEVGVRILLAADDSVLARYTPNSCASAVIMGDANWVHFDTSAIMGESIRVQFFDAETESCGFLSFDHVYQSGDGRGELAAVVRLPEEATNLVIDAEQASSGLIEGASFEDPVNQIAEGDWVATGAFADPASADAWVGSSDNEAAARVGDRALSTCEIGGGDCNAPTGTLTSPPFKVSGDIIQFLMAGGNGTAAVGVRLTDTYGNVLHSYTPNACEPSYIDGNDDWTHLDVSALANAYVQLEIFDEAADECGFVSTDHYYFEDAPWAGTDDEPVNSIDAGAVAPTAEQISRIGTNLVPPADAFEHVLADFDDAMATLDAGWVGTGVFSVAEAADSWGGTAGADNPAAARIGAGAVSTCEINDNALGCDAPVGTLTSPAFTVDADRALLTFLIAGGNGTAEVGLQVLNAADDMPIAGYAYTPNSCGPSYIDGADDWQWLDLSALAGAEVKVRLFDRAVAGCGFVSFDHLYLGASEATGNRPVGPISDINPRGNAVLTVAGRGVTVGITAVALDPDPDDTVTYSISGNDFEIDPVTGVVTVARFFAFYDDPGVRTVTVTATSSDGESSSQADFQIRVFQLERVVPRSQQLVHVTYGSGMFSNVVADFDDPVSILAADSGYTTTGVFADMGIANSGWNDLRGRDDAARVGTSAVSTCEIGANNCDAGTGTVRTPAFYVSQRYLNLLISGGNGANNVGVRLYLGGGGPAIASYTPNSCGSPIIQGDQHWIHFDLSPLLGQSISVEFFDLESAGCGFVSFDHVYQSNTARGTPVSLAVKVSLRRDAFDQVIGDFDSATETLRSGWTGTGVFASPADANVWTGTARDSNAAAARVGRRAVGTCEINNNAQGCDAPTGTLRSPSFVVNSARPYLTFLMGGGNGTAPVGLRVLNAANDAVITTFTSNSCSPSHIDGNDDWQSINLSAQIGQSVRVEIFDNEAGGCGFLSFDHVHMATSAR